jgi:voltage-dependent potassium channel beta subunit
MHYRSLGRSGLKISAVSLGSWRTFGVTVDEAGTEACLRTAYEQGVNFFDGAEGYGAGAAESAMGRVFRKLAWPRDTFCVSSKVFHGGSGPNQSGLSRKHVVEACHAALQRMGLDYLDLYYCHRPDPDTPLDEIVHTMNELIQRGHILYWGASNFSAADLLQMGAIAERDGLVGPAMEQPRYNMLDRARVECELEPVFARYGLGATVYSPLAVGILSGKYNDGLPPDSALAQNEALRRRLTPENLAKTRRIAALAREREMPPAQLALAWCLKNPRVSTVITGASRPQQVMENVAAADAVSRLNDDVMRQIETILSEEPQA